MQPWETIRSKQLVHDRWITLRADTCRTPKGDIIEPYYVLELAAWVNCLVIDADGQAIVVDQYRHGGSKFIREVVAGRVEADDASPADAVRRELVEEIGYTGGQIIQTGLSYANPAMQDNQCYSFLALGGRQTQPTAHEAGETMSIVRLPLTELLADIYSAQPQHTYQALHLACIAFATNYLKHANHPDAIKLQAQLNA